MNAKRPGAVRAPKPSIHGALRRCMQQAPLPFAITRGDKHGLAYANSAFGRMVGITNRDALGAPITTLFSDTEASALGPLLDRSLRNGEELLDVRIDPLSESTWRVSIWPVIADDGRAEALGIEIREPSPPDAALELQRQVAEQMLLSALRERGFADDAEAARRRAAFLAEASRFLAESVDQSGTLATLTRLSLPPSAAWCIVDIIDEDNNVHRLEIHHPDPEKQELAQELQATWTPEPDDSFGGPAMLRNARTIEVTSDIDATLAATAHSAQNLTLLRQLGIGSLLTVPLLARKRLLGAITFVGSQRDTRYSREDLQFAEEIAERGALALDNAQIYDMALILQHSAESANRAKTAFLGAMSHELRTPLNAIGGYIDLLDMGLRGPVTEAQRADFARVRTNQKHLAVLITEILNFVRVGSGRAPYAVSDMKACDSMNRAFELIEPLFAQKGLSFDGITGDTSVVARADPERVVQILINLLSNAIKFTGPGGRISASCGATGETVTVCVADTGIGISPEKQEAIFEPFIQLREGLSDREGGVGLGLAISRDLARAMKGDITVESSEGKGARFTLSLPRAELQGAPASAIPASGERA